METVISGLVGIGTITIALGIYRVANGRLGSLERKIDCKIKAEKEKI